MLSFVLIYQIIPLVDARSYQVVVDDEDLVNSRKKKRI
jgi:hypothetical protein